MSALRTIRALYASVAGGQIDRLMRRGRAEERARSETVFVLTAATMINLVNFVILLDIQGIERNVSTYAIAYVLFVASERLHSRWLRNVEVWASYHPGIWEKRRLYSAAFPFASFGVLWAILLCRWFTS